MANKTSQHILGTSANLLGFCLFVITALHLSDSFEQTIIDELTTIISTLLAISSILSFLSIRTDNENMEQKLETIADYIFIVALSGIALVIGLIAIHFIH
jgi:DMSO reductase anchor subunit